MTSEEIVALGNYCESLRSNPSFQVLLEQFEQQIVQHMMATEPHEQKKREGIYASYCGLRDFLGHMGAIVSQKNEIEKLQEPAPSEYDAQPQDFDD